MRFFIFVSSFLLLFAYNGRAQKNIAPWKNGKLRVSKNKHYLMHTNGHPFFWMGDTGWLLFINLTREEISQYFRDRQSKGFNVVQVMVVHDMPEVNVYGDSAFVNNNFAHPCTTTGNDFSDSTQYDYWDHVDYAVDEAAKYGIYLAMVPAWGSLVKKYFLNRDNAAVYSRWLALRYREKKNIIWLNGGDIKGSVNLEVFNIIGNTLKAVDGNHLISYHPFGRTQSSEWFHNSSWLDFNMVQSGHKNYQQDSIGADNWKLISKDYKQLPAKPVIDGEPSYEGIPQGLHDTTQTYWNENDARRYAYWSVFSGAFGHTYGNNAVMQFYSPRSKTKAYGAKKYWYDALYDPGAAQMQYLQRLILSVRYSDRIPAQDLLVSDTGKQYNHIVATRGKNYAFIYSYTGIPFVVYLGKISGTIIKASWFNPRTGKVSLQGSFRNKGIHIFRPPGEVKEGNDWVLILDN